MGHVLKTRVAETASLTGTGPVTTTAALTAHRRLADVCSVGDTTEYHIIAVDGAGNPTGAWEEGVGTYSSANTLTRPATPSDSSNAGSAVSFSGSVVVIMTPIAKRVGAIPRGGTVGQVVSKTGSGDFDAAWADQTGGSITEAAVATILHASTAKATLVDADEVNGTDSAASWGLIRTTWAQVWTYIKSKADVVYAPKGAITGSGLTMATGKLLGRSTAGIGAPEEITLGTNLSFTGTTLNAAGGAGSPGGSNTQVQYNNSGAFAGSAKMVYSDASTLLTVGSGTGATAGVVMGYAGTSGWSGIGRTGITFGAGSNESLTFTNARAVLASSSTVEGYVNGTQRLILDTNGLRPGQNDLLLGASGTRWRLLATLVSYSSYTVATLPSASTVGAGAQAYVTDANATTYRSTVAGGGSNKVQVQSDGTNWIITG